MSSYIVEYSQDQKAFHVCDSIEESIEKNLGSLFHGSMADYVPVAGPFVDRDEASAAIEQIGEKLDKLNPGSTQEGVKVTGADEVSPSTAPQEAA